MTARSLALSAALVLLPAPLWAQNPVLRPFRTDDDTPVKRAEPVRPPRPVPADPVETAATPVPAATPARRPRPAAATPAPAATPKAAGRLLPDAPEPSDPGELRMTPGTGSRSPDQAQLQAADSYYARKLYDVAAPEYQRYLDQFPGSEDNQAALYRLAECYRRMGSQNLARTTYDTLLNRYQAGDFIGAASFRLAEILYQDKQYSPALPLFRRASVRLKEVPVANAARFYTARCLEANGGVSNRLEATDIYRELAESDRSTNPFADASRLSLATLLKEAERTSEALKQISLLAKQTENPDLKAEATVKIGLWELELGQGARAGEDLRRALDLPGLGKWKEIAQVGLLRVFYDTGKYQQLLDYLAQEMTGRSGEQQLETLLLSANAHRQLGHSAEALAAYEQIVRDYPSSPYAKEAAYQRLVGFYNTGDARLLPEIDGFLKSQTDPQRRDQVLLMKAESLFKQSDFAGAAAVYTPVTLSKELSGAMKAEALFKLGWCLMQARDFDRAIKTWSQFIDENPTSKQLPAARVQRALAWQSQKNLPAAEKEYNELIKRYPKSRERELALEQSALIRGQLNDEAGMAEKFTQLLQDFPQTAGAAQANFWIGRTAYNQKDFKKAVVHLARARELDREHYLERASLPLLLGYYFLEDREQVAREVALYGAEGKQQVPAEVLRWLGNQYFEQKSLDKAEGYLRALADRGESTGTDLLLLGQAQLRQSKNAEAARTLAKYLENVREPVSRAKALQELARAQVQLRDTTGARKSVDEALTLIPDGELMGEGIILSGDIDDAEGNWEAAVKRYQSLAPLLDHEEITPRALEKAVNLLRSHGRDPEAGKVQNQLESRYPEYMQRKKAARPA